MRFHITLMVLMIFVLGGVANGQGTQPLPESTCPPNAYEDAPPTIANGMRLHHCHCNTGRHPEHRLCLIDRVEITYEELKDEDGYVYGRAWFLDYFGTEKICAVLKVPPATNKNVQSLVSIRPFILQPNEKRVPVAEFRLVRRRQPFENEVRVQWLPLSRATTQC
jgi:hypothetical protein